MKGATHATAGTPAGSMWPPVRTIAGAGLGMFSNLGPVLLFTFGLFMKPIASTSGWSTSALASIIGPAMLLTALAQPFMGILLDRVGEARFSLISTLAFAIGLISLGAIPHTQFAFGICLGVATLMGAGQTPLAYTSVISRHFDKNRGLALGVALSFSGIGVSVWPHAAGYLIESANWRLAYITLGLFVLAIGLVVSWLLKSPDRSARHPLAETELPPSDGMTLRAAVRTQPYWILVAVFFVMSAVITGAVVHLPALVIADGAGLQTAATFSSCIGLSSIAARFAVGAALDRFHPPLVAALVFLAPALGCVLLYHHTETSTWVAAILIGIGFGAEADVLGFIVSRVFGLRHFGAVYGTFMVVFLVGVSAGPAAFAFALSGHGGYPAALALAATAGIISAFASLLLRRRDFRYRTAPPLSPESRNT